MIMHRGDVFEWLLQGDRRQRVLSHIVQPVTATQLSRRVQLDRDECGFVLTELTVHNLVTCLNSRARRSRLFWLTDQGHVLQRQLRQQQGLAPHTFDFPVIDWDAYGFVCYRHRAAIVRALTEPLQPAAIKRRARVRDGTLRMSANNVRDALRELRQHGIVRPIRVKRFAHFRYELTDLGRCCQFLLRRAEV